MKKVVRYIILLLILCFICGCGDVINNYEEKNINKVNITEEEKTFFLNRIEEIKYLDFLGKSIRISSLTNQEILRIINDIYDGLDKVSFDDVEIKALDLFDYYVSPQNVGCDTHAKLLNTSDDIYLYSADDNSFHLNVNHTGHKEVGVRVNVYNLFKEGYYEDDKYTIVVYKVFSELLNSDNTNDNNYYKTYNDALSKKDMLFNEEGNVIVRMGEMVDSLKTYTYVFKKKDNKFVLTEYTIE